MLPAPALTLQGTWPHGVEQQQLPHSCLFQRCHLPIFFFFLIFLHRHKYPLRFPAQNRNRNTGRRQSHF